jgi:hypothetical protein
MYQFEKLPILKAFIKLVLRFFLRFQIKLALRQFLLARFAFSLKKVKNRRLLIWLNCGAEMSDVFREADVNHHLNKHEINKFPRGGRKLIDFFSNWEAVLCVWCSNNFRFM